MPSYSRLSDLEAAWKGFQVGRYANTAERDAAMAKLSSHDLAREVSQASGRGVTLLPGVVASRNAKQYT